jgi:hypothetical protein
MPVVPAVRASTAIHSTGVIVFDSSMEPTQAIANSSRQAPDEAALLVEMYVVDRGAIDTRGYEGYLQIRSRRPVDVSVLDRWTAARDQGAWPCDLSHDRSQSRSTRAGARMTCVNP